MKTFIAACALALCSVAPAAASVLFAVDETNSSVTLTENTASGGINCFLSNCGISADIAPGFAGTSFSLDEGETESFDFIRFETTGTTGNVLLPAARTFSITATLAFAPPAVTVTGNGNGGALLLSGNIIGGVLNWTNLDTQVSFGNGGLATIDFQDGIALFAGKSETIDASVKLDAAPIPLPAAGILMLGALGGLVAVRRRKAA